MAQNNFIWKKRLRETNYVYRVQKRDTNVTKLVELVLHVINWSILWRCDNDFPANVWEHDLMKDWLTRAFWEGLKPRARKSWRKKKLDGNRKEAGCFYELDEIVDDRVYYIRINVAYSFLSGVEKRYKVWRPDRVPELTIRNGSENRIELWSFKV